MPSIDYSNVSTYTDFKGLSELKSASRIDQKKALRKTAEQFEGLFLQMMLKEMRAATPKSELFDSQAQRMYQDLWDKQIALDMAKRSPLGIGDMIENQLLHNGMIAQPAEQLLKEREARGEEGFNIQSYTVKKEKRTGGLKMTEGGNGFPVKSANVGTERLLKSYMEISR